MEDMEWWNRDSDVEIRISPRLENRPGFEIRIWQRLREFHTETRQWLIVVSDLVIGTVQFRIFLRHPYFYAGHEQFQ